MSKIIFKFNKTNVYIFILLSTTEMVKNTDEWLF